MFVQASTRFRVGGHLLGVSFGSLALDRLGLGAIVGVQPVWALSAPYSLRGVAIKRNPEANYASS